ncbi:hypothetical protein JOF48_003593 [Arthrobacter stackebrandtii]|uniref:Uncharacterized protein n=1 Tax=Arthrobacter stackebrandtii TaxID=272161 RepID=A0ABS4Z1H6_9MICC|nr:hypothetical protein [Arthrobacter stackebrandtii]
MRFCPFLCARQCAQDPVGRKVCTTASTEESGGPLRPDAVASMLTFLRLGATHGGCRLSRVLNFSAVAKPSGRLEVAGISQAGGR